MFPSTSLSAHFESVHLKIQNNFLHSEKLEKLANQEREDVMKD